MGVLVYTVAAIRRNPKDKYLGNCQNYGPVLGRQYNPAPSIQSTHEGTIILTATHLQALNSIFGFWRPLSPGLVRRRDRVARGNVLGFRVLGFWGFGF